MSSSPVVLYLAGSGRSGSTLLTALLGQLDGWFAAGEVRYLWDRGLAERRLCGCGTPVPDCPVWADVLKLASGRDGPDIQAALSSQQAIDGLINVPRPFLGTRARSRTADRLGEHPRRLDRLYRAIAESTGSRIIVDSSKLATYGWVLDDLTDLDLRIVHVVRDPRATAHSWARIKERQDTGVAGDAPTMHRMGPARSATLWTTLNAAVTQRWSTRDDYLLVRYEDFVDDPRATLRQIAALAGCAPAHLPVADDLTADLGTAHTVAGNPDRLRTGVVSIRPDDAWRTNLSPARRALVTAITTPVRGRYGY